MTYKKKKRSSSGNYMDVKNASKRKGGKAYHKARHGLKHLGADNTSSLTSRDFSMMNYTDEKKKVYAKSGVQNPYESIFDQVSKEHGVPKEILIALAGGESSFKRDSIGKMTKYGQAVGIMQLMPATIKSLGITDPYDPQQNIEGGAKWLKSAYKLTGNWYDAIGVYNSGPDTWKKHKEGVIGQSPKYYKNIYSAIDEYLKPDTPLMIPQIPPAGADKTFVKNNVRVPGESDLFPVQKTSLPSILKAPPKPNTQGIRSASAGTEQPEQIDLNEWMKLYENTDLATDMGFVSNLFSKPQMQEGGVNQGDSKKKDNLSTPSSFIEYAKNYNQAEDQKVNPQNYFGLHDPNYMINNPPASGRADYVPIEALALPGTPAIKGIGKVANMVIDALNPISGARGNSEINWAKWNKEIPENKLLMKEYLNIERKAKKSGTWMKNSDGSIFSGTPEQFVQQQSRNFKEAFPSGYETGYRGSHFHINDFSNRDRGDYATFLTSDKDVAKTYASYDPNISIHNPNLLGSRNEVSNDGIYEMVIPKTKNPLIGDAENRNWRMVNYDEKVASGVGSEYAENNKISLERLAKEKDLSATGYDPTKSYLPTDAYAQFIMKNNLPLAKVNNVIDVMGKENKNPSSLFIVNPKKINIKSKWYNNGMFDMTNPNIYKSVIPLTGIGIGLGLEKSLDKKPTMKQGGKNKIYKRKRKKS